MCAIILFGSATEKCQAESIDSIFARIPVHVLPMLDRTAKLDMLDLYNSHMKSVVENVYGGQSEMLRKTDTELSINTTSVSSWTMVLLPTKADTIILCLNSLQANGVETTARTYNLQWKLQKSSLPKPNTDDYFRSMRSLSSNLRTIYKNTIAVSPVEIQWNDSLHTLTYSINQTRFSSEEEVWAQTYLRPIVYTWDGHGSEKFVLQETNEKKDVFKQTE